MARIFVPVERLGNTNLDIAGSRGLPAWEFARDTFRVSLMLYTNVVPALAS